MSFLTGMSQQQQPPCDTPEVANQQECDRAKLGDPAKNVHDDTHKHAALLHLNPGLTYTEEEESTED